MIQKQNVPINFAQGLDLKTDPKHVQLGKFLQLENSVFTKGGLLQKRNGYQPLVSEVQASNYLTTFNGNLTAIGDSISAYSTSSKSFIDKGSIQPMQVNTLPLIRNNLNQIQMDSIIADNGLILTVYTETNGETSDYRYVIADSVTGQNIVEPTALPVIATASVVGSSRVFIVGSYFVIVTDIAISGNHSLQYFSIPIANVTAVSAAQNVNSDAYVPISGNPGWDGVVTNNTLVLAYNTTTGGQGVHVTTLTQSQIASNVATTLIHPFTNAVYKAALLSTCIDVTANPNIIYVSFWNNTTTNSYTCAIYIGFLTITTQFTPQQISSSQTVLNIASAAQNGLCTVFQEINNVYPGTAVPTHFIIKAIITEAGSIVGSNPVTIRSVGLASKAFIADGVIYFLSAFQSQFQPSYFLINGTFSEADNPIVSGKLAYENGGGYLTLGLPYVTISSGNVAQIPYLFKDLIEALSTTASTLTTLQVSQQQVAGGIYSQTGINLGTFTVGANGIDSSEIGSDLHFSGGFLWMYDGYLPVEHSFFVWPEPIEADWTAVSTDTTTGTFSSGSTSIVVANSAGMSTGMTITDTTNPAYIVAGTKITSVVGTTVTISIPTTHAGSGDTLSFQGNIAAKPDGSTNTNAYYAQAVYSWSDNQGNVFRSAPSVPVPITTTGSASTGQIIYIVPTLRLTYKTANPVKIEVYRWSVANPEYFQVTSIFQPTLNDTTDDRVFVVDNLPDADIIGNNLIYTTGGVVEDINAPASNIMTLFDTRLWLVDAEDQNLLWFSKQVIESTPVEMSDLLTYFVPPTTAAQGTTGVITALAPMDDKLIIFKKNAIYYINGTGPDNTGSNNQYSPAPIFITSTIGCSNQQSIVFMPGGLMFQSENGIWLLGRDLSTQYIGAPVEDFNSFVVQSAINIPGVTQVRFTLSNGVMLMYDYYYEQWGTFVGAPAISACIYNNQHTLLNSFGQVSQETPGQFLDFQNPVLLSFLTNHIQLQGVSGYQRLFEIQLLGQYFSPHLLNVQLGYDFGPLSEQALITPTNATGVYGSDDLYGQTTPYGGPGTLEQWRIQNSTQKCQAFQLSVTEVYDPSLGVTAGAGFSLSAFTCVLGINRGYRPVKAANTAGTN